jgi:hypothetical protein
MFVLGFAGAWLLEKEGDRFIYVRTVLGAGVIGDVWLKVLRVLVALTGELSVMDMDLADAVL